MRGLLIAVAAVGALLAFDPPSASAQEAAINPQRDCQTLVTCQFRKGGSYRGCLSSYSCRVCRFVTTTCRIGGSPRKRCQEMRCTWG